VLLKKSVLPYCVNPAGAEAQVVQLEQQLAAARRTAMGLMGPGLSLSVLSPQEQQELLKRYRVIGLPQSGEWLVWRMTMMIEAVVWCIEYQSRYDWVDDFLRTHNSPTAVTAAAVHVTLLG
jgi:hypothetical protein